MSQDDAPVGHQLNRPERYPDLATLLEEIRRKPGMFLGSMAITRLCHFLDGIEFAEEIHKLPAEARWIRPWRDDFEEWVAANYNASRWTLSSFSLAYLSARFSEEEGFRLWYRWYDEYQASRRES
ncbi:hypothetical protein [Paludisphaera soli]|uniref:hypothetical protein n=1 Tax=Paludisphaera soli TaxID=2712865 RepID=UPI0013EC56B3|nr:hypothetical protein [Paludisphaera soli]